MTGSNATISAAAFLDGIGTDTHIGYTDGTYANVGMVISDLNYLGLHEVRDGITDGAGGSAPLSSYIAIAQAGIQFTFVIQATDNADLAAQLGLIDQVEAAVPGSVIAIEGPNEINNYPVTFNGTTGLQGALDMQAALYADVQADPLLRGAQVDYFTGYGTWGVGTGPDPVATPGLATDDNQHPYPQYGEAPGFWVSRAQALSNTTNPAEPAVYTETGYSTNNVNQDVQAVYSLDLLMDTAEQGISQTYLYQLLDAYAPGSPQGDDGYGLFGVSTAPKEAAVDIHNLTSILATESSGTLAVPVTYAAQGLPASGDSILLTNSGGSDVIAVWAEPEIWDSATSTEITAPVENVTISLTGEIASGAVYDPTAGTTPIATFNNATSIVIPVSDHPVLIDITQDAPAMCYLHGTRIATPGGEVPIETLQPGDAVLTRFGGVQRIKWIGRQNYARRFIQNNPAQLPVRIRAGALGPGIPRRDLFISPGHSMLLGGQLILARALVNGVTITQQEAPELVQYVQLEFAAHDCVLAEGAWSESYADAPGQRDSFHNAAAFYAAFPAYVPPPELRLCAPRPMRGPALAAALRPLVAAAAARITPGPLRGWLDEFVPGSFARGWAQDTAHPHLPVLLDVLLDGTSVGQVLACDPRADLRAASIGNGQCGFHFEFPPAPAAGPCSLQLRRAADGAFLSEAQAYAARRA
jgi:hypothetical protein